MKEENSFDFNTYSKGHLTEEEDKQIFEEGKKFYNEVENEKRKSFHSLPTDEHKVAWLKKALMNSCVLNNLLMEFLPPLMRHFPQEEHEIKEIGYDLKNLEQVQEVLSVPIAHAGHHISQHLLITYALKKFMEKARVEKEEIEKLKEMMK